MLQLELSSAMFTTAAILLGCCYFFLQSRRNAKLPPCPVRPWPLVGNIFSVGEDIRAQFRAWHSQCGGLFSLYFGPTLVVVVSGYKTIKEVFVQRGAVSSDRPRMYMNEAIGMDETGIIFASGAIWKELRSTTLQILKEFGLGTNMLADKVHEEVEICVDKLAELDGEPVDLQHVARVSVSNVICNITVGKRFGHDDPRFKGTVESLMRVAESSRGATAINFLPFLKYIPGDMFKAKQIGDNMNRVKDLLVEIVSEIESTAGAKANEDREGNYVFSYRRREHEKMQAGKKTSLDYDNMIKTIVDLFSAGTETVSSTIAWCVLFIINKPSVQVKVHEEIDREIGQQRQPTMADQARLPYLGAVIKETQRLASIIPFSIMHKAAEDITIGDITIPKGTALIPNLDSVLHDPEIWGSDADTFNPERFIDKDGALIHREEFIPFSIGPRICVGEALGKIELFLFLSAMFQRFHFKAIDPLNPPTLKPNIGITAVPAIYDVICIDRFKNNHVNV
ncbi:hypothetical protein EGW08_013748 [Elysia chlorotica]|uniref:Cytochrome P450 n=1 Tax=Elysia chlorotica TaxID=188477 RepID=A0A3S1B2R8_ELYCH|nr:hypothetical protein EGW08_013748 [Elysia chlorotica]